jgi:hypothetical protein
MALNQIIYTDKVENSGATDDGKVLAVNMNEIKNTINANADDIDASIFANTVKIGADAGLTSQGANSVIIGLQSGEVSNSVSGVHVGHQSGRYATGNYSSLVGFRSGENITAGQVSCLGSTSGVGITTQQNVTCLGSNAQITAQNQVQLGDSATTTYAYGAVQDRSDARDKADIQDIHLGLDFIKALTPKSYKFDYREDYREHTEDEEGNIIFDTRKLGEITHDGTHTRSRLHTGLIAQEVKQVMDAQGVDFSGYQDHSVNGGDDVLSLGYTQLIAPMIKAIQELEARIAVLEAK